MSLRLASVALVVGAALADATGHHSLAYYALVIAVPVVALAALAGLGDVLDGSAAEPHDRGVAMLSALALPFVLVGTAVRAPLIAEAPPPVISVTAIGMALAIFAVQALVRASVAMPTFRAVLRANR
jgi:hypothetical protein